MCKFKDLTIFFFFFFCIYKTYLISAERYKNVVIDFLIVKNADEVWVSMTNVHTGLGVKNMSDLVLKEIYCTYERTDFTDEEIRKYKMTEREVFGKGDNLSEN